MDRRSAPLIRPRENPIQDVMLPEVVEVMPADAEEQDVAGADEALEEVQPKGELVEDEFETG